MRVNKLHFWRDFGAKMVELSLHFCQTYALTIRKLVSSRVFGVRCRQNFSSVTQVVAFRKTKVLRFWLMLYYVAVLKLGVEKVVGF